MDFDYAAIAAEAAEILREFGAQTTLKRPAASTYDTVTGQTVTTPTTDTAVVAAVFPYADKHIDGTLILATDQQAFVGAVGVSPPPKPGDLLTWRGADLNVVRTRNLGPSGAAWALFELQLR